MTTRPLTDEHLAEIRARIAAAIAQHRNPDMHGLSNGDFVVMPDEYQACYDLADAVMPEVEKLRAELADAHTALGSLGSQLAAVKAERDELRGIARALRITVVEMLSGKQPTAARAMVWQSTLKYATEALSADEPGESEDDNPSCQQGCGKTATSWGVCDDHMPDVPERDATPYRVWHGACPPAHFDPRWQWACKLCDAVGCGTGTEAQNRAEAEQHIATQHAERGGA